MTISVVICTYNGEKYLQEQINSILNQSLLPDEIIIADDLSSDRTWDIISNYCSIYPNLIFAYKNNERLGAHSSFKEAFLHATCELIAPCDQDDIWNKDKLMTLHSKITNEESALVCHQETILYESGRCERMPIKTEPFLCDLLIGNSIPGHIMLFKKELLQVFDIAPEITYDWGIAIYATIKSSIQISDYIGCCWRRHSSVVTSAYSEHNTFQSKQINKYRKFIGAIFLLSLGNHNNAMEKRWTSIYQICKNERLKAHSCFAKGFISQNVIGMLHSAVTFSKISAQEKHTKSIRSKIHYFTIPLTFWYDYRNVNAF